MSDGHPLAPADAPGPHSSRAPTDAPGPAWRQPAEWDEHEATWLAWPWAGHLWEARLEAAQREWTALAQAIAWAPEGAEPEPLEILAPAEALIDAWKATQGLDATVHGVDFGDIWMRDIAPIFLRNTADEVRPACFRFNGWGEKYVLDGDAEVAAAVAELDERAPFVEPFVLEGGSVEVDGEGTVLTTRQCLLNPNRNPRLDEAGVEAILRDWLGATKVLWLDEGLLNDHTDGHIDTLARFVAPGVVVCMAPSGDDDPNAAVLDRIAAALSAMTDAAGRALRVVRVPSPGRVLSDEGDVMPASYVNFYIANHSVIVPTYGTPHDDAAVAAIAALFPDRRTVGLSARAILEGGGAFHCITQQVPVEYE